MLSLGELRQIVKEYNKSINPQQSLYYSPLQVCDRLFGATSNDRDLSEREVNRVYWPNCPYSPG